MNPTVAVSWGELIDKLTILEIKSERLESESARARVLYELDLLRATARPVEQTRTGLGALKTALKQVNERLWQIEDDIRAKEAAQSFDADFIALARAVYRNNDERGRIKAEINLLLGSGLREEKQYTKY